MEAQGYNKLVEALRICSSELNCGDCPLLYRDSCSSDELMSDAAAAIEALQAEIRESMQKCAECGDEQEQKVKELQAEVKILKVSGREAYFEGLAAGDNGRQVEKLAKRNAELHAELEKLVSAAEKAGEPKRGEWVRVEDGESYHYECSECGERPLYSRYGDVVLSGVCPMCGAKMTGEQDVE